MHFELFSVTDAPTVLVSITTAPVPVLVMDDKVQPSNVRAGVDEKENTLPSLTVIFSNRHDVNVDVDDPDRMKRGFNPNLFVSSCENIVPVIDIVPLSTETRENSTVAPPASKEQLVNVSEPAEDEIKGVTPDPMLVPNERAMKENDRSPAFTIPAPAPLVSIPTEKAASSLVEFDLTLVPVRISFIDVALASRISITLPFDPLRCVSPVATVKHRYCHVPQ
jgi:hypothetical protein